MDDLVTVGLPHDDEGTRTKAASDVAREIRRHVPLLLEGLLSVGEGSGDPAAIASDLHGRKPNHIGVTTKRQTPFLYFAYGPGRFLPASLQVIDEAHSCTPCAESHFAWSGSDASGGRVQAYEC